MPRLALYSLAVCVLAVVAAVISFTRGMWLGIVWVLIAGLSSNMTWYYFKRGRIARASGAPDAASGAPGKQDRPVTG